MRIDYRLKDALSWRFVVVAILPLVIVSSVTFNYFSREIEQRLIRENISIAGSIAAHLSLALQEPQVLIREFVRINSQLTLESQELSNNLNNLVIENDSIESVLLLDKYDRVVATGMSQEPSGGNHEFLDQALLMLPQIKNASADTEVFWSRVSFSKLPGQISLALAGRIHEGLVIAHVNLGHLHERFLPVLGAQSSQLLILDRQRNLVFQLPPAATPDSIDLKHLQALENAAQGKLETRRYDLNGKSYLGSAIQIPTIDWIVLFGQEHSGITSIVWRLRLVYISALLLAILLAVFWARLLAKKIVRPLSDLAQTAESFSEGDYRGPLPYGHHLEIDRLSDSFRSMRQMIDEREKALLQNQTYFSRLFNGVTDAIMIAGRNDDGTPGHFIEVNDVACQLLGYSREVINTLSPYQLNRICLEDPDAFNLVLDEIHRNNKALYKTDLLNAEGDWLPVEISCHLFELDGQQVYFSVARDITLREKYESSIKTLVRSTVGLTGQDCLDEIVQNLCSWLNADGASIGLVAGERLNIQASCLNGELKSPFSLQLSGTPYAEILSGNYRSYTENASSLFPALSQFKLAKIKSFIGIPMVGHDGRVLGVVSAFSRRSMIAVPHVEELLSVIASRAAAECERLNYVRVLANNEEMLRTLFNSTAEAIVGIDLQGDCVFCNPSTLRILGYDDESELIGRKFHSFVDREQLQEMNSSDGNCPFIALLECEEKVVEADGVLLHKEGQAIPVEYWVHPMLRDDQLVGGVITFIDISRRRILEKRLQHSQRMEAIGTLTGGIAHDFNNILTVISGYAGLLQSLYPDDMDLYQKIGKIAEAADRGSKLTHGLLAYSRKKTGPSTPVDLNQLVIQVQDLFGKIIGEHIDSRLSLSDEKMYVLADTPQLEQVLVNLATNARDAMSGGGILTITTLQATIDGDFCKAHGYGEPGDYGVITVEDNGVGMCQEVLQYIFDPFYTTKDTGKGTGLGLAIAWGIIKQHKGYILVDSDQNQGTRVQIYLPLTSRKPIPELTPARGKLPGGSETLLLVEDDPQVLETTYNILVAVGYQVITGDCAKSALETLDKKGGDISLLLSDVVMPGIKGSEFYQEIRKRTDIPVVFISGYTFDTLRDQGLVGDDILLLNKPISPLALLTKIREILDLQHGKFAS